MKPLEGLRVLDMSRVLAGPFAGRILSDLGADVVKVEPPEGDVTRNWGKVHAGQAGYYVQQNVGKRNVCIDLAAEGGPDLIRRLVAESDILIENYRPGVMAKFGLSWDDLKKIKPSLVMLSISGFGQVGPESHRAAYAPILHAESGWYARAAKAEKRPPADAYLSVADTNSSMHGIIGVLAALRVSETTGVGQHVDLAMLDAMLATDDASHGGLDKSRFVQGGGIIWDGVGGYILISGDLKWTWHQLHNVNGLEDPSPEGAEVATKVACREEAIQTYLLSFETREEMIVALDKANLAWGSVQTTAEAFASPTAQHRNSSVEIDARDGGTRMITQTPYRFSDAETGLAKGSKAPHRGEHNAEVLSEWLGASGAEAEALEATGALLGEPASE